MSRLLPFSVLVSLVFALVPFAAPAAPPGKVDADRYRNPLKPSVAGGEVVESCADPAVLRGRGEDRRRWYMYCTTDPLNDAETAPAGAPEFHPIPMLVSTDLVNWKYVGDALPSLPSWADPAARLWAPDIVYSRATDRYYLTFTVTETGDAASVPGCAGDSAIGVATSKSPTGPWKVSDTPVVGPRQAGEDCSFFWTFDPDVLGDDIGASSVLYYGSYFGGVFGQRVTVTEDGMTTAGQAKQITEGAEREPAYDPVTLRSRARTPRAAGPESTAVTIPNRYEGSTVVRRGGWYYYFGSATNCCNGPLTGYSVYAGRSRSPLGPFVDREGNSLLAGRVGGTPVISMNGNRWVGTGHNSVFRDLDGQWWTAYHAVDRNDPYFEGEPGFTKRPALLDPVTWVDGWPSVRAGRWASDNPMPAPAAQPGERSRYRAAAVRPHRLGRLLSTDDFDGNALDDEWSWLREPADPTTYDVENGRFRFDVQAADLFVDDVPEPSVLLRRAPRRDFVAQTKVSLDVPPEGCCFNFAQGGLVLYGSDDSFVKLTHTSIYETRQTEWAKEVPSGLTRYGNTVVGAPGDETWLRIVKETRGSGSFFTAYTSQDGRRWVRGGTWEHNQLGRDLQIGLVSMGADSPMDLTSRFDHLRVWTLKR